MGEGHLAGNSRKRRGWKEEEEEEAKLLFRKGKKKKLGMPLTGARLDISKSNS